VFSSAFLEGDSTAIANSPVSLGQNGSLLHRRTVTMTEDFDVVHNVLDYIYTNRITFSTTASQEPESKGNQPNVSDAQDIFALAHRLDLEDLKRKALKFLEGSCTLRNITSRVFSQPASLYDEVGKVYDEYFTRNWATIQNSAEFKENMSLIEESEPTEILRVFRRFREIFQGAPVLG
jgi:hypothetical protein